jgi:single-strand DNA-binding protein
VFMANDLNSVFLIGRLTRDPEFKIVNNSSLVNFSLANNRVYVTNGAKKEEVNYFECVAWGKLADIIKQYATKGKQVMVEGRLRQESWDTPDGKKASKVRVVVNNLQLLGGGPSSGQGSSDDGGYAPPASYSEPIYDPSPKDMDVEDIF